MVESANAVSAPVIGQRQESGEVIRMANSEWTDGIEDEMPDWYDPNNPWTPLPGVRTGAELTRGEIVADVMRNRMGSWAFVGWFLAFMLIWAVANTLLSKNALDPFPFILLNLFLSMLAGLQGAILLIAAKRADAIAAEQALSHLTISRTSSEIIHAVHEDIKNSHRLVKDVHHLLKELHAQQPKENP